MTFAGEEAKESERLLSGTNGRVYINFARYTMHNVARHPGGFIKPYITIAIMARVNRSERQWLPGARVGTEKKGRADPAGFARVSDIIAEGDTPLRDARLGIVPL